MTTYISQIVQIHDFRSRNASIRVRKKYLSFLFDWTVPPTEFAITLNARSLRRRKIRGNCRGKSPKREKRSTYGTQLVVGFVEGVDALVSHSVHAIEPVLVSANRSVTLKTETQGFNLRRHASFMCLLSSFSPSISMVLKELSMKNLKAWGRSL